VEAALVAFAFVLAIGLMARGVRGGRPESHGLLATDPPTAGCWATTFGPAAARPPSAAPPLATVVPGQPPLRIFSARPAEVMPALPPGRPSGDYRLTLTRGAGGRWSSVLRAPEAAPEGGALTVTLVVPWGDLAQRYSAVNLVVR
jgi:hypothetical protein